MRRDFIFILVSTLAVLLLYGKSDLVYSLKLHHSKTLPYPTSKFVGRTDEMEELDRLLDINNRDVRTVSIVGSPGFGKSTLAIQVGHNLLRKGFTVHYVNMIEVLAVEALPEKLLDGAEIKTKNATTDRLLKWSRDFPYPTVMIFDNCDSILHKQQNKLQGITKKLLQSSSKLKIMMTSRRRTMQLANFRSFPLRELSKEASCTLLQNVVKDLDSMFCERMTNLTGNVPLALLVVGSLLNLPNPPTPDLLINNLKIHLMATLSPEDLPDEDRVNASIALSYQYLNKPVQKVGRHLASFPGSFDKKAACEILLTIFRKTVSCNKVDVHLNTLVQRSLLEYNQRTDRYQFHRLIREFFVGVQKSIGKNGLKESRRFAIAFQLYYSKILESLANQFSRDYASALHILDTERHNIEKLLLSFSSGITTHTVALSAVMAVESALHERLLHCRFSREELASPVLQIITYLDEQFKPISARISLHDYVELYVNLITTLARLESGTVGIEVALMRLEKRQGWIEQLDLRVTGNSAAASYTNFYSLLADYNAILGRHDIVKKCHEKILKKAKELTDCTPGQCDYFSIGMAYYRLGNYKQSTKFLELFLKNTQIDPFSVASALITLQTAYKSLNDANNAKKATIKLIDLFPELMGAKLHVVHHPTIESIINLYVEIGKVDEAYSLKEKLLMAEKEILGQPSVKSVSIAIDLALFLFKNAKYPKAAEKGKFALEGIQQLSLKVFTDTEPVLLNLIGIAEYYNGNRSESVEYLGKLVDSIYQNYTSATMEQVLVVHLGCFYITIQGQATCVKIIITDIIVLWFKLFTWIPVGAVDWNVEIPAAKGQKETLKPDEPNESISADSNALITRDQDTGIYGLIVYKLSNVLWKHLFEITLPWLHFITDLICAAIFAIYNFINFIFTSLLGIVYVRYLINILWILSKACLTIRLCLAPFYYCFRVYSYMHRIYDWATRR